MHYLNYINLTINKCICFYPGIVSSNTRDFAAKVTYPHLNFSIPVSVLEPLLSRFAQTQDPAIFQELDSAEDEVRSVWRLQIPQSKLWIYCMSNRKRKWHCHVDTIAFYIPTLALRNTVLLWITERSVCWKNRKKRKLDFEVIGCWLVCLSVNRSKRFGDLKCNYNWLVERLI